MKKFLLSFFCGVMTAVLVVLALMFDGTPFKAMLIKYGLEDGVGIVSTERFVVVYEGMEGDDAGASNFTYAGTHGSVRAPWRGYGEGWSGGANGITTLTTYEPDKGTAIVYFHGKLLQIEGDGRFLHLQNQRFTLGPEKIVAVVDKNGLCRQLRGEQARVLVKSIPEWYQDPQLNARPPKTSLTSR